MIGIRRHGYLVGAEINMGGSPLEPFRYGYVVVFYPLKRNLLCTRRRTVMILVTMTILGALLYSFAIWTAGITTIHGIKICATLDPYVGLLKVLSCLDSVLTLVIPSFGIMAMNGRIGLKIYRYTKGRMINRATTCSAPPSSRTESEHSGKHAHREGRTIHVMHRHALIGRTGINERGNSLPLRIIDTLPENAHGNPKFRANSWHNLTNAQISRRKFNSQMRITRLLFITSSVFVLLNLPSHAFRIYAFMVSLQNQEYKISIVAFSIQELLQFFYYLSFAANFFLYNACSRTFRTALRILCRRLKYKFGKVGTNLHRYIRNCRIIVTNINHNRENNN